MAPLLLEYIGEGRRRLRTELEYACRSGDKAAIKVPVGFVTDLDSVPRLPFAYWLTKNASVEAAIIHDYLYAKGTVSRARADRVFLEAMEDEGVPRWQRVLVWLGVRVGGWLPWSRYRKAADKKKPIPSPPDDVT